MATVAVPTEPTDVAQQEDWMIEAEPVWSNSLGWSDGQKFYLTHFPIWCRTKKVASIQHDFAKLPESGVSDGVQFAQSLGRIELRYPLLNTEANYTAEDLDFKLSVWEMQMDIVGAGKKKDQCIVQRALQRHQTGHILVGDRGVGRRSESYFHFSCKSGAFSMDQPVVHRYHQPTQKESLRMD